MSGWHPNLPDGGIAPNPNDLNNPSMAFPPTVEPVGTSALYYGNGCDVRLRPHVINALISENLAVLDRVGLAYNPSKLTNLRTAIEYIVQRGLPKYSLLDGGPYYYTGVLDPPCQQYNNGQVALVVPTETNRSFVRLDLGGGNAPVLRNDAAELEANDWRENIPEIIGYFNGAWYMLGLCASQVPIVLKGQIDFWIRPDGNDLEADGMENTPQRAFRTINGCWAAVGSRYAASPASHIAMKLGVPGNYEAGYIGPYGATVSLTGDVNNRAGYRIVSEVANPINTISLYANRINTLHLRGINLVLTNPAPKPNGAPMLMVGGTLMYWDRIQFSTEVSHSMASLAMMGDGSALWTANYDNMYAAATDVRIVGNGQTIMDGLVVTKSSFNATGGGIPPTIWYWNDISFLTAAYLAQHASTMQFGNDVVIPGNTNGPRYLVTNNSYMYAGGQPIPGSLNGSTGPFSTFTP